MCGILGVVNLTTDEPVDLDRLRLANDALIHRGPDDSGVWTGPGIGLAMRRLSIIDVAHGHQPLSNEDGTVQIVYNGEVYNHAALRQELQTLGHRFRTTCDTEVIVHAYEQWGADSCLQRLRGMFAFAIWDTRTRTLVLARDRMGIKPLYIAEWNGRLFFASELRALFILSLMPRRVRLEAMGEYLDAGFVTSPRTMFMGVRKLSPAHYLIAAKGRTSLQRYWTISYEPASMLRERDLVERFRELLAECVSGSLMSEVPLGALLSGGIDSTMIVALMRKMSGRRVTTVSMGFDIPGFDEAPLTVATARALDTDHRLIRFTGDSMEEYPKALASREEPAADSVFVALYGLFQACRREGLTVVLTGEGADELLGGYYWHRADALLRPLLRLPRPLRVLAASNPLIRRSGEVGLSMQRILRREQPTLERRYMDWIGADTIGAGEALLSSHVRASLGSHTAVSPPDTWTAELADMRKGAPLHQMLWLESRTRMIERINHNIDRMSMAHSVEARPPFLDHILWEFCATVPASMKLHGMYGRQTEKYLLRESGRGLIPEAVRVRKKKGLATPFGRWFSRTRLPEWAESTLSHTRVTQAGLFDPEVVIRLRREHQLGAPGRTPLLMAVLSVQLWAEMFIDSPLDKLGTPPS